MVRFYYYSKSSTGLLEGMRYADDDDNVCSSVIVYTTKWQVRCYILLNLPRRPVVDFAQYQ